MSEAEGLVGETLDDRYEITSLLGEGGMGRVYEGIHLSLDRRVALKVLHPRLAHEKKFRERFLREARSASRIRHPNVVQILDFGHTPDRSVYFAMEFLEGRDLRSILRKDGPLPWPRVRHLLHQAASALKAAHGHGIIHRDIKPANCMLCDLAEEQFRDVVKLLDFGIAKVMVGDGDDDDGACLTGTGEVFGTAVYMAPEQALGLDLDARSDVYSLGAMAYEMVAGRVPFKGTNPIQIITRHVNELPQPPRVYNPSIRPEVEALVLKALAKRPEDRFASMAELEAALLAIPEDDTVVGSTAAKSDAYVAALSSTGPVVIETDAPGRAVTTALVLSRMAEVDPFATAVVTAPTPPPLPTVALARRDRILALPPAPDEVDVATTPHAAVARERPTDQTTGSLSPGIVVMDQALETSPGAITTTQRRWSTMLPVALGGVVVGLSVAVGAFLGGERTGGEAGDQEHVVVVVPASNPPASRAPQPERGVSEPHAVEPEVEVEPAVEPAPAPALAPEKPPSTDAEEPDDASELVVLPTLPPRAEPSPTDPSTTPKKRTDASGRFRLTKRIKRACRVGHEGERISIELTVGSTGAVLTKNVSARNELKLCVDAQLSKAKFPEGSVRVIKFSVDF